MSPLPHRRLNNNPNPYLPLHHLLSTLTLFVENKTVWSNPYTTHVLRAGPAIIQPATMVWYSLLPPYLTVVETWIIRIAVCPNSPFE
jgi:hypothetical protein